MVCTECGGQGHMRRICPSATRYYGKNKEEAARLRQETVAKVGQFNQLTGEIEEWEAQE